MRKTSKKNSFFTVPAILNTYNPKTQISRHTIYLWKIKYHFFRKMAPAITDKSQKVSTFTHVSSTYVLSPFKNYEILRVNLKLCSISRSLRHSIVHQTVRVSGNEL